MLTQSYKENYRELRNAEIKRDGLSQEKAHKMVTQCQIVSPKTYVRVMLYQLSLLHLCI